MSVWACLSSLCDSNGGEDGEEGEEDPFRTRYSDPLEIQRHMDFGGRFDSRSRGQPASSTASRRGTHQVILPSSLLSQTDQVTIAGRFREYQRNQGSESRQDEHTMTCGIDPRFVNLYILHKSSVPACLLLWIYLSRATVTLTQRLNPKKERNHMRSSNIFVWNHPRRCTDIALSARNT